MTDYISREMTIDAICRLCNANFEEDPCEPSECEMMSLLCKIPAADVRPALWTDEPISGTEFMTHSQGQGGFEIHFRTDDKAKYEAVQDECRRQIDHAKPAADVRPVARCRDCKWTKKDDMDDPAIYCRKWDRWEMPPDGFCSFGEKREES